MLGFFIQISLQFVSFGPISIKPVFDKMMAWCWTGDNPSSETIMSSSADKYMHFSATISQLIEGNTCHLSS